MEHKQFCLHSVLWTHKLYRVVI